MALGQSTKRESEENKNTNTKTNEKGEGKGRGTNNILFNGCLNENIVSHHHTERKLLAKNDMREKERARNSKEMSPSRPGRWGGARWGRSPSLPPSDLWHWAGRARPEIQAFPERPMVSRHAWGATGRGVGEPRREREGERKMREMVCRGERGGSREEGKRRV